MAEIARSSSIEITRGIALVVSSSKKAENNIRRSAEALSIFGEEHGIGERHRAHRSIWHLGVSAIGIIGNISSGA